MNDYDREILVNVRDELCNLLDDYEIGDELRGFIDRLYDIVDDFITDVELEGRE